MNYFLINIYIEIFIYEKKKKIIKMKSSDIEEDSLSYNKESNKLFFYFKICNN